MSIPNCRAGRDPARLAAVLVRTAAEDRDAFRELYSLTADKLFGVCLTVCGEHPAAEDVLHDVYLRVWNCAGGWEPSRGSAIAWLSTIARNKAIDWRRRQKRTQAAPLECSMEIVDPWPTAEALMLSCAQLRIVHHCLDSLAPHQRNAIACAFFHGDTHAELAERAHVPLGTMKSWIRRGLAQIRDHMELQDNASISGDPPAFSLICEKA